MSQQRSRWKHLYGREIERVDTFCLDTFPVTEQELAECVSEGACKYYPPYGNRKFNPPRAGGAAALTFHPAASAYCAHKKKRLPLLEEWLWAAGGGAEDRRYPWGDDGPSATRLNACDIACAKYQMTFDCMEGRYVETGERCTLKRYLKRFPHHPWDDGYPTDEFPVGAFPAGAGRWGNQDFNLESFVVVDATAKDEKALGFCGDFGELGEDRQSDTLHDDACFAPRWSEMRSRYNAEEAMGSKALRCAADVPR